MKFLGIDLGWQSGPSGLCCLEFVHDQLLLQLLDRRDSLEEVLARVDDCAPGAVPAMVAVDAPLVIPNEKGMRSPDRLSHKYFGKYHAGGYPINLASPYAEKMIQFSQALKQRGFEHASAIEPRRMGRYQIEVFPHPATIQLFNLLRILKYKKGRLAERSKALSQLRDHILTKLPQCEPPLFIEHLPEIPAGGKALKALEDRLDSVICAYVAAHWWYWGVERNVVMGDLRQGYVIIPCPPEAPVQEMI
ncbi:MAG: DUF429 domain-containing protein [Cyanobacteria bacterium J06581_3]